MYKIIQQLCLRKYFVIFCDKKDCVQCYKVNGVICVETVKSFELWKTIGITLFKLKNVLINTKN